VKTCARCKTPKQAKDFYRNSGWRDGCHPYCKECLLDYQRERRRAKLDRIDPNRRRWSRSFVRHEYFNDLSDPSCAYLAGLLAADGNILERQRRLTLELSRRDEELVRFARDELAPGFPLRTRVRPNGCATSLLAITSARVCADLAAVGITPRKSLSLRWPEQLERTTLRPFLLGFFDGDGFVTRSRSGRYEYGRWGLCGTEQFLSAAMQFIASETGVATRRVHRAGMKNTYRLHVNGADALVIDRWLQDGTGLGLARKRLTSRADQADIAASSSSLR
jgi:hypothetical protein